MELFFPLPPLDSNITPCVVEGRFAQGGGGLAVARALPNPPGFPLSVDPRGNAPPCPHIACDIGGLRMRSHGRRSSPRVAPLHDPSLRMNSLPPSPAARLQVDAQAGGPGSAYYAEPVSSEVAEIEIE